MNRTHNRTWQAAAWSPLAMPAARSSYVSALRRRRDQLRALIRAHQASGAAPRAAEYAGARDAADQETRNSISAAAARLVWVTAPMTAVADAAAATLPPTWTAEEFMDDDHGICSWEQSPITVERFRARRPLHAVHWTRVGNQLRLDLLARVDDLPAGGLLLHEPGDFWGHLGAIVIDTDRPVTQLPDHMPPMDADALALFASTMILARQQTTAERTDRWVDPDRPGKPPRPARGVQIIDLRRRVSTAPRTGGEPRKIEHEFRWEVGHHWRTQHYGPGNTLTKLVFIEDYEAGPKDKPLRPRAERVYRLSR